MIVESVVEIIGKKMADILGDKAATLLKKDRTRAASYEAYVALRHIEGIFSSIQYRLEAAEKRVRTNQGSPSVDELTIGDDDNAESIAGRLAYLGESRKHYQYEKGLWDVLPMLRELTNRLEELKGAFAKLENKMEIYRSIEKAAKVRMYIGDDDDVVRALLGLSWQDYRSQKIDVKALVDNMCLASALARAAISSYIKDNYKVEQSEKGH